LLFCFYILKPAEAYPINFKARIDDYFLRSYKVWSPGCWVQLTPDHFYMSRICNIYDRRHCLSCWCLIRTIYVRHICATNMHKIWSIYDIHIGIYVPYMTYIFNIYVIYGTYMLICMSYMDHILCISVAQICHTYTVHIWHTYWHICAIYDI